MRYVLHVESSSNPEAVTLQAGLPKNVLTLLHITREDAPKIVPEIIAHEKIRHINVSISLFSLPLLCGISHIDSSRAVSASAKSLPARPQTISSHVSLNLVVKPL